MAKNDVFEIEVIGWDKHNNAAPKSKKMAFKYFMVAKSIFDDHKLAKLTTSERYLYMILLGCCAEAESKEIRCSRDTLRMRIGSSKEAVEKQLKSLEENQLVKWLNSSRLISIKDKGKSRVEKDKDNSTTKSKTASLPSPAPAQVGRDLVAHYCDVYKTRYKSSPVVRPQDAKALKNFGETVGVEKAKLLISAYLRMSNSWFITKAHDLVTFLQNLNQIQNFIETGQVVTIQDARNAETENALKNQIARLTGDAS
jgi:DNA-binding MarR family transcriptional regulator